MRKIGILGGSFDPVHLGHAAVAALALRELGLDAVYFEPNRIPYYRGPARAGDADRLAMLRLAAEDLPGTGVSDFELRREGFTSTAAVLAELARRDPGTARVFILGTDSFLNLHTWRDYRSILRNAHLAVFRRPGCPFDPAALPDGLRELYARHRRDGREIAGTAGGIFVMDNPETDASSTEVRRLLAAGSPRARALLPEKVAAYIAAKGLYRGDGGTPGASGA